MICSEQSSYFRIFIAEPSWKPITNSSPVRDQTSILGSGQLYRFCLKAILAMTTDEVLNALGRYTKDSRESDRQMATKLGINRITLSAWLRRKD